MPYTNNTPQASQKIAFTQPLILDNFGFLATGINQEHNFVAGGTGTDMYHRKASMPNLGGAPVLPAGTDGMYYVDSAQPRFWDGTTVYPLFTSFYASGVSGLIVPGGTFQIVAAGNYMGFLNIIRTTTAGYQFIQFHTNGASLITNNMASGGANNIVIVLDGGNNIMVQNTLGSNQNYIWQVFYNAAP